MRFNLTLNIKKESFGALLPLKYQYECSALIYKILFNVTLLYPNSFKADKRQFNLFSSSQSQFLKYRIIGEFEETLYDSFKWQLSFYSIVNNRYLRLQIRHKNRENINLIKIYT